jgi:transcriptional regulator with XRE-family HTH domain
MKLNIKKLEAERKRLGLKMPEFSKRLGFTATNYGKMVDSRSTSLKTLTKIAAKLNLDPRDLLSL